MILLFVGFLVGEVDELCFHNQESLNKNQRSLKLSFGVIDLFDNSVSDS